jgi:hypothetical protein
LRAGNNKNIYFAQITGLIKYGICGLCMKHISIPLRRLFLKPNARLNVKMAFPLAKIMVLSDGLEECTLKGLKKNVSAWFIAG